MNLKRQKMHLSRCNLNYYALVLLVVVQMNLANSTFSRNDCERINVNSKCQCTLGIGSYDIECPAGQPNPNIRVVIQPDLQAVISCYSSRTNYTLLPNANIGNIPNIKITDCPLPGPTPIAGMFEYLGITNAHTLFYETRSFGINITRKHMERLQGFHRLHLKSRVLTYFPKDLFMDLKNLTWLDLKVSDNFDEDLFAPLEHLHTLELSYNRLENLPRGIFRNQHKLKHLNIRGNQLRNLSKYNFEGVSSIEALDLTSNGMETLQPDVFELLTNLDNINLNANNFTHLPNGLFDNNNNLTEINLKYNRARLITLPSRLLANKPKLRVLKFICFLESLPDDLLSGSIGITNISLANNKIRTLPAKLFADQESLLDLDLHDNQLESLPDQIFYSTKKLIVLNLSQNKLSNISGDLFASLGNLEQLNIARNQITVIHPQAFQNLRSLLFLDLSDNAISDTDSLRNLVHLNSLLLSNNAIMYIPDDWKFVLLELKRLDLSNNNITKLTSLDLQFQSSLKPHINLAKNQIVEITFTHLEDIEAKSFSMNLNDNPLDCNCVLLTFVQYLRNELPLPDAHNLNMTLQTENLYCQSPERLKGKNVKDLDPKELLCSLDLDSKQKECPSGCECWVRTYDMTLLVNCSNGNLTQVPPLPKLTLNLKSIELFVENNRIKKLPTINLPGYSKVSKIFASRNNISKLEDFNLPMGLTHLDLSNNHLTYLNDSALGILNRSTTLENIKLSRNPWTCDCNAAPFLIFMQKKFKIIKDIDGVICKFPHSKQPFQHLSIDNLCPENKSLVIAVAVVISLLGFLIGLAAALYYKYQLEIKIWLYAHKICLWFVTEEEVDKDKKYDGFVSYSHHDREFVEDYLVPMLEKGDPAFKLCVHERDFVVGGLITEQIIQSIDDSRRTIVVLSKNFIESTWAKIEFQTAHKSALTEGRTRVILIIYGDIGDIELLDNDLKAYLKMNTYLKWGDPWFWDKLRYAMPHRSNKLNGLMKAPLKGSTDDKLELIKPLPVTPTLSTPPAEATKNPLVAHLNGKTPQTTIVLPNAKLPSFYSNGTITSQTGHVNGAFIINTNAKQSDV